MVLTGWRTNAAAFILPRLAQRFLFNFLINKVKKLRVDTVGLIEKHGLQDEFVRMNANLPTRYQRDTAVKLADEIMYFIGFAGVGGTCAAVQSCAAFLQNKIPEGAAGKHIKWGVYDTPAKMQDEYRRDPVTYIKETCRLDPPVTSATTALKELTKISLAGTEHEIPEGTLEQYTISMANRDPGVFEYH